jgi:hypothetical protein
MSIESVTPEDAISCVKVDLSNFSIEVTGKFRLKRGLILLTVQKSG